MDSKIIKPRQSLLERFMMHWLNLIGKHGSLGPLDMKTYRNKTIRTFFTRLLNPCLHFPKQIYYPQAYRTNS